MKRTVCYFRQKNDRETYRLQQILKALYLFPLASAINTDKDRKFFNSVLKNWYW